MCAFHLVARHALYPPPVTTPELPPMARPRVAAGALFTDDIGRVLLLRLTYKSHWDIPGGYVEPDESPRAACVREIGEELGITFEPGRLLVVDWAPLATEGDKLLFIFDGGLVTPESLGQVVFSDGEVAETGLFEPSTLDTYTPSRLSRRLQTAIRAKNEGRTVYAEHGHGIAPESS